MNPPHAPPRSRALSALAALLAAAVANDAAPRSLSAPPAGAAGQPPTNTTCSSGFGCHVDVSALPVTLRLVETASASDFTRYVPGTTYPLTFSVASTDTTRRAWGFETTALVGTTMPAGATFTAVAGVTTVQALGGVQYVSHAANNVARGILNGHSWTFSWRAPAADVGDVTFYACGNAANNNGSSAGDNIQCTTFRVSPAPPADSDLDGVTDQQEVALGTEPLDADSDDDGLGDGEEVQSTNTDPTSADSDGDGLQDGTEVGRQVGIDDPDAGGPAVGTDLAIFEPDTDPGSTTDPNDPDTDGDTCLDGDEDVDSDGFWDQPDETSPRVADCPVVTPSSLLRLSRTFDNPPLVPFAVFAAVPCNRPSPEIEICAEAPNVTDIVDASLPLGLSDGGVLLYIEFDSDITAPGSDLIDVVKNTSRPGNLIVSLR